MVRFQFDWNVQVQVNQINCLRSSVIAANDFMSAFHVLWSFPYTLVWKEWKQERTSCLVSLLWTLLLRSDVVERGIVLIFCDLGSLACFVYISFLNIYLNDCLPCMFSFSKTIDYWTVLKMTIHVSILLKFKQTGKGVKTVEDERKKEREKKIVLLVFEPGSLGWKARDKKKESHSST